MIDELAQVHLAIQEREVKCREDMKQIEEQVVKGDHMR